MIFHFLRIRRTIAKMVTRHVSEGERAVDSELSTRLDSDPHREMRARPSLTLRVSVFRHQTSKKSLRAAKILIVCTA